MRSGKVLLAGNSFAGRRTNKGMPYQQIQTFGTGMIERWLQVVPQRLLPMRAYGGEAFSKHEFVAVCMRCRSGLLHEKTVLITNPMPPGPRPEFAHRRVVKAEALLRINRHRVRP